MRGNRRIGWILFFSAAVIGLAADLASKSMIFAWLGFPNEAPLVLIPDWLQFVTRLNNGGIWSIGAEHGLRMNGLLIVFGGVASILILAWGYFGIRPGEKVFPFVLGLILAGALGNLHDRIVHQGVRDFIEFHYQDIWYFPTFNVADSMLVCGAVYLILASLWSSPDKAASHREISASASP